MLIRGRKLTGRDGLGFGVGKVPLAEMTCRRDRLAAPASTPVWLEVTR